MVSSVIVGRVSGLWSLPKDVLMTVIEHAALPLSDWLPPASPDELQPQMPTREQLDEICRIEELFEHEMRAQHYAEDQDDDD